MTLSLEEVLREHFGGAQPQRAQEQDTSLRRLKAEHLKARGDEAIKQGNYRQAWERYSEAIDIKPDKEGLHALYSNRSLAYSKAQRYSEALADADMAVRLAPAWQKAHWRRAAALLALKRVPEAVLAYRDAWKLAPASGDPECEGRLWQAVQRLTREQLAGGILQLLAELQEQGQLEAPHVEAVSEQEMGEALFRIVKAAHQGKPKPGPFYHSYLRGLKEGVQPAEAYIQRAAVHSGAKCYLQARADAQAAVALLLKEKEQQQQQQQGQGQGLQQDSQQQHNPQQPKGDSEQRRDSGEIRKQLALAYQRLGEACLAERGHADRDCRQAAKAFLRVAELDEGGTAVQDLLQEATEHLTMEELNQVQREVYNEGSAGAAIGLQHPTGGRRLLPGQRLFHVVLRLAFPAARAADCSSRARELLRVGVAAAAGVSSLSVSIERVLAPTAARQQLLVCMQVQVGTDVLKANALVKAVTASVGGSRSSSQGQQESADKEQLAAGPACSASKQPEQQQDDQGQQQQVKQQRLEQLTAVVGGAQLVAVLGQPDPELCSAEIEDITPACVAGASEAERAQQEAINRGGMEVPADQDRRLVVPARPKLDIELPYKLYKLVRADGSAPERVDKHPFCMSRVYYDASEKPEEVWAELLDGSCRWRQTGGEVKVLALRVPHDLPTKHLAVDIQPYSLKVWNLSSGEVYLEGALERGVVPEDCFWTHCGGEGEDGCALYLRKMNLELLQKHWMHSEMWWPRLFRQHGEIAWDDYEKDYSDLPEEVLQRHRVAEAIKDVERKAEDTERQQRESLQERDDMRKRARQERLNELRTGTKKSWVHLHRALPAVEAA